MNVAGGGGKEKKQGLNSLVGSTHHTHGVPECCGAGTKLDSHTYWTEHACLSLRAKAAASPAGGPTGSSPHLRVHLFIWASGLSYLALNMFTVLLSPGLI